jgi:hypothetical protein
MDLTNHGPPPTKAKTAIAWGTTVAAVLYVIAVLFGKSYGYAFFSIPYFRQAAKHVEGRSITGGLRFDICQSARRRPSSAQYSLAGNFVDEMRVEQRRTVGRPEVRVPSIELAAELEAKRDTVLHETAFHRVVGI